ncbi:MAG: right-handed parallel beta-helix repeat-containing protein, partial [Candidatus Cloacimonadales bacterium]|nr:right-handed parallel beta-helix repeat-containing protein [Candidatus Cloacimonadales bacterium]
QTNILVFDSDYDFEEMLASYENDELHVTFKTEENDCPKYKILRCGIEPENLYSKTEFGTYHPGTIPSTRGTIEDNILRLAFDDDYFYVNYEYSDYVSENLLTEDLVIHKGFFNEIEVSGTSVFGVGNITFTNKITVPTGTELVFLPGSHPTLTSTAKFDIYGSVTAVGQPDDKIFFNTNSDWDGFYIQADAGSNFQYCEFENSDDPVRCLGLITMKHCTIKNCTNGLYLQACDTYVVEGNEFYDCVKFGLFVSNINHLIFLGTNSIWNNLLHDNSYGIYLFNTNVKIDSNYVYDNTQIGIIASSGTASIIENCCIQDTYSNNPEIYLVDESYPVIDYRYNDIIFNRGYSIYNADREYELYNCRNNYWGTTTSNYIADSFYPSNWEVYYYPYLVSDTTGFYNSRDISLFEMGLMAEEANQFQLARECYLQCIDESDYEIEKIWAASRLINCVDPENGFTFTDAQQLYETISADTSHIVLSNLAQKQAVNCDRKNGDFQEAIMKYEDMLTDSLSYIDSILVQLNIIHTYFEAESTSGRATLSFKYQENAIRDHEHARQKEASLLDLIREEIIEEGHFTPVIDKSILYNNYPNPFNPETTISFSIPEDSKVGITIYNIKGQKVKTLVSEDLEKGIHKIVWDSKDSSGKSVSSGVYFYKLDVNGKTKGLKKMLLLK